MPAARLPLDASPARGWVLPLPRAAWPSDNVSAHKHGCCEQPSDSPHALCHPCVPTCSHCLRLSKTFPFSTSRLQLYLLSALPWSGSVTAISDTDSKEETEKLQKVEEGDPFGAEANVSLAKHLQGLRAHGSLRSLLKCHLTEGLPPSLSPSPQPVPLSHFVYQFLTLYLYVYMLLFGSPFLQRAESVLQSSLCSSSTQSRVCFTTVTQ